MSTLFTAVALLAIIVIFIGLFNLFNKKAKGAKALKQENVFETLVWKNKLAIQQKERINDYILAIDNLNFVLVYIDFSLPREQVTIIDLWNVRSVQLSMETTGLFEHKRQQLQLAVEEMNLPTHKLVLYDVQQHGAGKSESTKLRGEYWHSLIQHIVKELSCNAETYPKVQR